MKALSCSRIVRFDSGLWAGRRSYGDEWVAALKVCNDPRATAPYGSALAGDDTVARLPTPQPSSCTVCITAALADDVPKCICPEAARLSDPPFLELLLSMPR